MHPITFLNITIIVAAILIIANSFVEKKETKTESKTIWWIKVIINAAFVGVFIYAFIAQISTRAYFTAICTIAYIALIVPPIGKKHGLSSKAGAFILYVFISQWGQDFIEN